MDQHKQAFSLIELLVVVLVIGILAAVAVPQYQKAVLKSRMMEILTLGRVVMDAQKVYYLANGVWADDLADLDIEIPTLSHGDGIGLYGSGKDPVYPRLNISFLAKEPKWAWNFRFVPSREDKDNYIECYCHDSSPLACSVCQNITGDTAPVSAGDHTTYVMPYSF